MRKRTGLSTFGPTLTETKNYLRVDFTDDDELIRSFVTASFEQITAECNQDFLPVTYSMSVFSSSGQLFLTSQHVNFVSTGSLMYDGCSWFTIIDSDFTGNIIYHCIISK